jgi:hypothetical protein
MTRSSLARQAATLVLLSPALLAGCGPTGPGAETPAAQEKREGLRGLTIFGRRGGRVCVENGYAYDRATVDLGNHTAVVVPADARVERGAPAGRVEIYLEKHMGYGGYAVKSIREERKKMGCARKSEGDKLLLAGYGWWTSIEGGTGLTLLIRLPDGLPVEKRRSLSGPNEEEGKAKMPSRRSPSSLGPDWEAIPDEPDPAMTAWVKEAP